MADELVDVLDSLDELLDAGEDTEGANRTGRSVDLGSVDRAKARRVERMAERSVHERKKQNT